MSDVPSPHLLRSLSALIVVATIAAGCADDVGKSAGAAPERAPVSASSPSPEPSAETGAPTPTVIPAAEPESIVIPAIDVDAEMVGVGLADDGAMETPDYDSNLAGWYTEGPVPGAPGPSVIVAHVDHPGGGPDTFARLDELDPGDEIVVSDVMGADHTFVVTDREQTDKDGLPYDRIWPATSETLLTLITCDGPYVGGEYSDNLIVYTEEAP